jgi:hypothetical protein
MTTFHIFDENTLSTFLGYPTPGNALMSSNIVIVLVSTIVYFFVKKK